MVLTAIDSGTRQLPGYSQAQAATSSVSTRALLSQHRLPERIGPLLLHCTAVDASP